MRRDHGFTNPVEAVTSSTSSLTEFKRIPPEQAQALREQGAVVVDLPKDIMNPAIKLPYSYPENVKMRSYSPTLQGHRGQIKRALQTLLAAKQPIIYAGGGVISSGCHEELRQLAERLNIPVTTSLMGLGGFPWH